MHPRNRYAPPHDFPVLAQLEPRLAPFLKYAPDGRTTLDFSQPEAVYLLNRTLLLRDYQLRHWDIPAENLIPPIPGRLDYIHALHDLHPTIKRVLDIGTGASLIYPILGVGEYGWSFLASEVDGRSYRVASAILKANFILRGRVKVVRQPDPERVLHNVLGEDERVDVTMCNPPFFPDEASARAAASKKWNKLGRSSTHLSFRGTGSELRTPGGEAAFIHRMIRESADFAGQVAWFTTLVSKNGYLRAAAATLNRLGARDVQIIPLEQGNKRMRMLAWTFSSQT